MVDEPRLIETIQNLLVEEIKDTNNIVKFKEGGLVLDLAVSEKPEAKESKPVNHNEPFPMSNRPSAMGNSLFALGC